MINKNDLEHDITLGLHYESQKLGSDDVSWHVDAKITKLENGVLCFNILETRVNNWFKTKYETDFGEFRFKIKDEELRYDYAKNNIIDEYLQYRVLKINKNLKEMKRNGDFNI